MTGEQAFKHIADLHAAIDEHAVSLKMLLANVDDNHPALVRLDNMVREITRIIIALAQRGT